MIPESRERPKTVQEGNSKAEAFQEPESGRVTSPFWMA